MFDEDDPILHRLRARALELPSAQEKVSHGRPTFFTTKVFATYGGTVKGDHDSDRWAQSVLVKPDEDERLALTEDERVFVPAYVGVSGWIGYDLRGRADWGLVGELLDMSYRNTAPKRLVAALEEQGPGGR